MKIAVCDDEPVFLKRIYDYLWQQPDCSVECFSSSVALWDKYVSGERYDVLFLDILMSPLNGMELAKRIRKIDTSVILVFFTACLDYAPTGYEVGAFRYLLKPVTKEAISRVMRDIYAKLTDSHTLLIKTPECELLLHPQDLQYLKADNKNTLVYHKDDVITLHKSLNELEAMLPPSVFFRIHRKYIVNLEYVREFDETHLTLACGATFPVSRRRGKDFRRAVITYIEGGLRL